MQERLNAPQALRKFDASILSILSNLAFWKAHGCGRISALDSFAQKMSMRQDPLSTCKRDSMRRKLLRKFGASILSILSNLAFYKSYDPCGCIMALDNFVKCVNSVNSVNLLCSGGSKKKVSNIRESPCILSCTCLHTGRTDTPYANYLV